MIPPLALRWDGEALIPAHAVVANRHLVVGARYVMVEHEQRSRANHDHQFAWIADAWANLPEALAEQYGSPDHLRRHALIAAGFFHESQVDAGSHAAALRFAAFIRADDSFAVAVVRGPICIKRVAESQSLRAMGNDRFKASKAAILDIIGGMLGVTPETLTQNAARAA